MEYTTLPSLFILFCVKTVVLVELSKTGHFRWKAATSHRELDFWRVRANRKATNQSSSATSKCYLWGVCVMDRWLTLFLLILARFLCCSCSHCLLFAVDARAIKPRTTTHHPYGPGSAPMYVIDKRICVAHNLASLNKPFWRTPRIISKANLCNA